MDDAGVPLVEGEEAVAADVNVAVGRAEEREGRAFREVDHGAVARLQVDGRPSRRRAVVDGENRVDAAWEGAPTDCPA